MMHKCPRVSIRRAFNSSSIVKVSTSNVIADSKQSFEATAWFSLPHNGFIWIFLCHVLCFFFRTTSVFVFLFRGDCCQFRYLRVARYSRMIELRLKNSPRVKRGFLPTVERKTSKIPAESTQAGLLLIPVSTNHIYLVISWTFVTFFSVINAHYWIARQLIHPSLKEWVFQVPR